MSSDESSLDPTEAAILQWVTVDGFIDAHEHVARALQPIFLRQLPPSQRDLRPEEAQEYFTRCADICGEYAKDKFAGYSYWRWLYYLRSLPGLPSSAMPLRPRSAVDANSLADVVRLRDPIVFAWSRRAAEALAASVASVEPVPDQQPPPVDEHIVRRLLRLLALGAHLYSLSSCYVRSAKGIAFVVDHSRPLGTRSSQTVEQTRLLAAYDARVAQIRNPLAPLGLAPMRASQSDTPHLELKLAVPHLPMGETHAPWACRFAVLSYPFDSPVADVLRDVKAAQVAAQVGFAKELGSVVTVSATLHESSWDREVEREVRRFGWVTFERASIEQLLQATWNGVHGRVAQLFTLESLPACPREVMDLLLVASPRAWPNPVGRLVVSSGERWVLDLASMRVAFEWGLNLEGIPDGTAVRSRAFERATQAMIDGSAWARPEWLKGDRPREVKIRGQVLTDLDAVGYRDGVLLAVSCKSMLNSPPYWAGTYRQVRNRASDLKEAVQEWHQKMARLRENLGECNQSFGTVREIVAIVVAPFPVYTEDAAALEDAMPGLRRASSYDELGEWLLAT